MSLGKRSCGLISCSDSAVDHRQCQTLTFRVARFALSHVGMSRRQPHPRARGERDHRDRSARTQVAIVAAGGAPITRRRRSAPNSISITPGGPLLELEPRAVKWPAALTIFTAASTGTFDAPSKPRRCRRRHVNTWLAFTPCRRATTATDAPAASVSSTIRHFRSSGHRRRPDGSTETTLRFVSTS